MKYLLDTNVLSEAVKTTPNQAVLDKFEQHKHEIATAAPVWHEMQYGRYRLPRYKIELLLNDSLRMWFSALCPFCRMVSGLPGGMRENEQGWFQVGNLRHS